METVSSKNIAAVILAAGASTRMGEPKQLLKWGSTNLIGHVIETVAALNFKDVFLVLGAHFNEISQNIQQDKITILKNNNWQQGLGTSIACAVQNIIDTSLQVHGVLIVLCDQPFITVEFLNKMLSEFEVDKKQIITTAYQDGKNGVPALFDRYYFESLRLLKDDQGAKDLIQKYSSHSQVLKPSTENYDLDTKEDYANLYSANFKS